MKRLTRCSWGSMDPLMQRYHDEEWGVPVHDDRKHFEFLVLEGAQAGLSWRTVLHKREAYRKAYAQFDPQRVARFGPRDIRRLLSDTGIIPPPVARPEAGSLRDPGRLRRPATGGGIIRNRLKIEWSVRNAGVFLAIQEAFGSFDAYIWRFVGGRPTRNRWRRLKELPACTPESDALSRDLKQRGMAFVGSTIIYAHMQAAGLVNDHLVHCFRHRELRNGSSR